MRRFLNHIFETFALTRGDQSQLCQTIGLHGRTYRAERFVLFGYPVERIERDHKLEFFPKRQAAGVTRFKSKVRPAEVGRCKGDHIRGRVDAHNSPFMNASSNLGRNFAVTASQIEHTLGPFQVEEREHFGGHGLLKSCYPGVSWCVPFGHLPFSI